MNPTAQILFAGLVLAMGPVAAQTRDVTVEHDTLPPSEARWALVIGVDDYADPQISPLRGAANDAAEFAAVIQRFAGFPKDQVILLTTNQQPSRRPSRANILFHLSNLSALVPPNGLFLFFFAGHGVERNGEAFLLPYDARLTDNLRILNATGISFNNVREWIQEMPAKQILAFLDACRNDPTAARGAADNPLTKAYTEAFDFSKRNRGVEAFAVLYATAVGSRAFESSSGGYGFFTGALVDGLKGGAADSKGEVTLGSLVRFVQETVPKRVRIEIGVDRTQRPFAEIHGYRADQLVLAKLSEAERPSRVGPPPISDAAAQLEAWSALRDSNDPNDFLEFYKRYPDGPLAEKALERREELAWTLLQGTNDLAALRGFYQARPHGGFADQALARIEEIEKGEQDRTAIQAVLDDYQAAYRARDADRVAALWPTLSRKDRGRIRDFFQIASSIEVELTSSEPTVTGDRAIVECHRVLRFEDEKGVRRVTENALIISFLRTAGEWALDSIETNR